MDRGGVALSIIKGTLCRFFTQKINSPLSCDLSILQLPQYALALRLLPLVSETAWRIIELLYFKLTLDAVVPMQGKLGGHRHQSLFQRSPITRPVTPLAS
jgi:hypothetical protein